MLRHLYIKNFTIIDSLDIDFHEGFSVITGETGAGKSIVLGAINLLLGQRADSKMVRNGAQKCIVEAEFEASPCPSQGGEATTVTPEGGTLILRREVSANGKSRAFIDDSPVSLSEMREVGARLIDIHSQHKNLLINDTDFQLNVVDIIADKTAGADAAAMLANYKKDYADYTDLRHRKERLERSIEESRKDEDYLRFQQEKLSAVELRPGIQEELEQEQELLAHAEDIKNSLYEADNILSGDSRGYNTIDGLREVVRRIEGVLSVYPSIEEAYGRLKDAYEEIKDLSDEVSDAAESIDDDPHRLEEVNDKLDAIYSLQKRYNKSTVEQLIEYKQEIDEKLRSLDNFDDDLALLTESMNKAKAVAKAAADKLTATRRQAAELIKRKMLDYLVPLGIPKVRFEVEINETADLTPTGQDEVRFLFSANTSTALAPVSEVASGGEIARVMLSLKAMISGVTQLPTIIFDEIDTGVSGKVAEQMALIMDEMSQPTADGRYTQVISITHLPQIASKGRTHYKVLKEETDCGTTSRMTLLSPEERVMEVAQMLSGSDITEAAVSNAKELLRQQ